jgi:hypothetical protein
MAVSYQAFGLAESLQNIAVFVPEPPCGDQKGQSGMAARVRYLGGIIMIARAANVARGWKPSMQTTAFMAIETPIARGFYHGRPILTTTRNPARGPRVDGFDHPPTHQSGNVTGGEAWKSSASAARFATD